MSQEYTFKDVAAHNTKKDLFLVIHDKVYNSSSFVDEHPGGEEVLLDVAGQDATEAFEDVGHSDEAREILEGMKVGTLKRVAGDPDPKPAATDKVSAGPGGSTDSGFGVGLYAIILAGGLAAYFAYSFLQAKDSQ